MSFTNLSSLDLWGSLRQVCFAFAHGLHLFFGRVVEASDQGAAERGAERVPNSASFGVCGGRVYDYFAPGSLQSVVSTDCSYGRYATASHLVVLLWSEHPMGAEIRHASFRQAVGRSRTVFAGRGCSR